MGRHQDLTPLKGIKAKEKWEKRSFNLPMQFLYGLEPLDGFHRGTVHVLSTGVPAQRFGKFNCPLVSLRNIGQWASPVNPFLAIVRPPVITHKRCALQWAFHWYKARPCSPSMAQENWKPIWNKWRHLLMVVEINNISEYMADFLKKFCGFSGTSVIQFLCNLHRILKKNSISQPPDHISA